MYRDNKKDISDEVMDYSYIAVMSEKLKIGIIGGGRAGEIKAKHFCDGKCYVEILSKTFSESIIELHKNNPDKIKLIKDEFSYEFLNDKHIVIIAVDDEKLNKKISSYCIKNYKLYVDCSNFRDGNSIIPVQIDKDNMSAALNTKCANPRGTVFVGKKVSEVLDLYDDFVGHTAHIRNRAKQLPGYKDDILRFIAMEDYKELYDNKKEREEFYKNFPEEVVDYLFE